MDSEKTINMKERIIDAAIEVIKEKSVEDATVREIAIKAGLTTGAIYYHYKNKDELFCDIMNKVIHFVHGLSEKDETDNTVIKDPRKLLREVQEGVKTRLSGVDEEKLHVLLLSDAIAKNGVMKEKYNENYANIISKVGDMYYYTFGMGNKKKNEAIAAILVAALDGMAIQHSLNVFDKDPEEFIRVFIEFFTESIPAYLEKHKD